MLAKPGPSLYTGSTVKYTCAVSTAKPEGGDTDLRRFCFSFLPPPTTKELIANRSSDSSSNSSQRPYLIAEYLYVSTTNTRRDVGRREDEMMGGKREGGREDGRGHWRTRGRGKGREDRRGGGDRGRKS